MAQALRKRLAEFSGIPTTELPPDVNADLRPYQRSGFDFLCHLSRHKLGGILADDMGLGQNAPNARLALVAQANIGRNRPALVDLSRVCRA